uniref:Ig-like domain-containing protein n=2 Tax=Magallana gigas TaxID=29159 RepID=A0A8W8P2G5_MAGGI|nr:basement membrane-specific heparan sulfate proteoglycan core protein-like [Crassostrea gigas]
MHTVSIVQFLVLVLYDLSYAGPLQIVFTDQPSHITVGSEVHLTCVVSGGSSPHTTWISPTGLLPPNSHMINEGKTLVITHFDVTNNGQYICVTSDGFQFAHHVFTVNLHPATVTTTTLSTTTTHAHKTPTYTAVYGPPSIVSVVIRPTFYQYGDDVEMACAVESNPDYDQLGWNMLTAPSLIPSNLHLNYTANKVTLHINGLKREDIGDYECFVHNSVGSMHKTVHLTRPH